MHKESSPSGSGLSTVTKFVQNGLARRHVKLALTGIVIITVLFVSFYNNRTLWDIGYDQVRAISKHYKPYFSYDSLIPSKIWQIYLSKASLTDRRTIDPEQLKDSLTWLAMNPGKTYTLLGLDAAEDFLYRHFSNTPHIIELYKYLPNVGMKSDLLRYLTLSKEGGIYTDIDTIALKQIDAWIPEAMKSTVRLVVGIEFDRRDGNGWADISHWVQFCQWTIAAAPGHEVFPRMVNKIFRSVEQMTQTQGIPIHELLPGSFDVMNTTGPAAWTDAVFELLQERDPALKTTKDLSFMTESKLFGDILVLPINGFGMGQSHSHSTNDGSTPDDALVQHMFRGSWRDD